ncbi:MAG TPA: CapA family protein [Bacteroidales bacterium]|nr:CapA family protein [Bacteroidales bacterium]HRZ48617.1 CapA family protein [Bacteroidales bacterium]
MIPKVFAQSRRPLYGLWFATVIVSLFFIQAIRPPEYIKHASVLYDTLPADSVITLRLLAAGDAMAHLPQTQAAWDSAQNSYAYADVFKWISPVLKGYDLRFINLETPLGGEPYKGYPQFSAPDAYAADLFQAGFNYFFLANNHAVDRYNRGILRTIHALDSMKIPHTGIFSDSSDRASRYPVIIEKNGIRLAILNATFSTNGISSKPPVKVNYVNRAEILADLASALKYNPDFIIMVIHWGDEYKLLPGAYQTETAKFLAENGVDVIIGHHPHVLQPVGWIKTGTKGQEKETLVIWSLGNFFSNQRDRYRDGAMFTGMTLEKNLLSKTKAVHDIHYYPFWVRRADKPLNFSIIPCELPASLLGNDTLNATEKAAFEFFSNDTRNRIGKESKLRELRFYTEATE